MSLGRVERTRMEARNCYAPVKTMYGKYAAAVVVDLGRVSCSA